MTSSDQCQPAVNLTRTTTLVPWLRHPRRRCRGDRAGRRTRPESALTGRPPCGPSQPPPHAGATAHDQPGPGFCHPGSVHPGAPHLACRRDQRRAGLCPRHRLPLRARAGGGGLPAEGDRRALWPGGPHHRAGLPAAPERPAVAGGCPADARAGGRHRAGRGAVGHVRRQPHHRHPPGAGLRHVGTAVRPRPAPPPAARGLAAGAGGTPAARGAAAAVRDPCRGDRGAGPGPELGGVPYPHGRAAG